MNDFSAVVVDDNTVVRVGLPLLVPQMRVVGAYASVEALLAERPPADLAVLDLRLAGDGASARCQGTAAVRAATAAGYRTCLYTDERRRLVLAQCLRAGAAGVVHKSDSAQHQAEAFAAVAAGETVITQSLVGLAELADRHGGMPELTERQRAVLSARARGMRWSAIGAKLFITEGVAREHMNAVTAKFAGYLAKASPGDIERALGLAPGDLLADDDAIG